VPLHRENDEEILKNDFSLSKLLFPILIAGFPGIKNVVKISHHAERCIGILFYRF
jgi:proteasome assembly chaperone (PAC2) family protein